jgi:hypothetical protein
MVKGIAGVAGGLVVWMLVATLGNLVLRFAWPGYADVEKAMTFTVGMLIGRLVLGAVATACAGTAVAVIAKRNDRIVALFAGLLVLLFIPVHYNLWNNFPLWYHVVFFALLVSMTFAGAAMYRRAA